MAPFHKILVSTDFSNYSVEAVAVAAGLSRLCQAPLTVMTVYETLVVPSVPEGEVIPTPKVMVAAYERTRELVHHAAEQARVAGAFAVDAQVLQGSPFTEIVTRAREGDYDLIVLGTHGRTGLKHFLLGSVAERVVRRAPCAVLTVRLPAAPAT
jgi:nucleotide-binding universal stress UspA family protein